MAERGCLEGVVVAVAPLRESVGAVGLWGGAGVPVSSGLGIIIRRPVARQKMLPSCSSTMLLFLAGSGAGRMSRRPVARHSEAPLYGPSEMWMSPPDAAMLDDCLERRMSVSAASNAGALITGRNLISSRKTLT